MARADELISSGKDVEFAAEALTMFKANNIHMMRNKESSCSTFCGEESKAKSDGSSPHSDDEEQNNEDDASEVDDLQFFQYVSSGNDNNKKKARKYGRNDDTGPTPPPDMPEIMRNMIEAMNGVDIVLVIQKRLTLTDIGQQQNSLSIPFSNLFNGSHDFLTDAEKRFLTTKDEKRRHWNCIQTQLLDSKLSKHGVPFKRWAMRKTSGAQSDKYVLNKTWNKIVESNGLDAGDVIQIWAFRVDGQLSLALVKLEQE